MTIVFFTIADNEYYESCRTDEFISSFKRFHPDIELKVFREEEIYEEFKKDHRLNFGNCKATFAKKLYNDYDLVVNIDADHLIFARLDEILIGDYDVACPYSYNGWQNSILEIQGRPVISSEKYVQGGLIASTSKRFWDDFEYASLNWADWFGHRDNDVLNILWNFLPYEKKLLEGAEKYNDLTFECFYGCSSLGQEQNVIIKNNQLELNGKPFKAYHFSKWKDKVHPKELFSKEVVNFIYTNIV